MEGKRKGGKTGGRQAGTPNKVTTVTREVWAEILSNNIEHMQRALDELRMENPKEFVNAMIKMNEFVVPKMSSVNVSADEGKTDVRSELAELMKSRKKKEE